jgi:hypothetical protein
MVFFFSNPIITLLSSESVNSKGFNMKFAFIPKGQYKLGQYISVHGKTMKIVSYTHTGRNVIVQSLFGAPKFEQFVCICTDSPSL